MLAASEWRSFDNFCVDKDGNDLPETPWNAGNANRDNCKQECSKKQECSAFEWYNNGLNDVKCHLMLGKIASAKGHTGDRFRDAQCFIKPG